MQEAYWSILAVVLTIELSALPPTSSRRRRSAAVDRVNVAVGLATKLADIAYCASELPDSETSRPSRPLINGAGTPNTSADNANQQIDTGKNR